MKSLWPDFNSNKIKKISPAKILDEQSEILYKATANMLRGDVEKVNNKRVVTDTKDNTTFKTLEFAFSFKIESEFLSNYSFELLKFYHSIEMYPVYVEVDKLVLEELLEEGFFVDGSTKKLSSFFINDQDSFVTFLEKTFATDRVQTILSSIMDLATDFKKMKDEKSNLPF